MAIHSTSDSTRAHAVDGSSTGKNKTFNTVISLFLYCHDLLISSFNFYSDKTCVWRTRCIANDRIVDASGKMTPEFCPDMFKGVGKASKMWTTELGWIARHMTPLQVKVWRDIPKPRKADMVARLEVTC